MRLSRIEISGFRGVRDPIDLRLPSGFTVISGRNGSGKSTFCDAIEYVFTGDIRRESDYSENQESYADYIRWRGEGKPPDGTYVRLHVQEEDGHKIVLERELETSLVVRRGVGGDGAPENSFKNAEEEIKSRLCDPGQAPDNPLRRLCETSIIRDERITDLSVEAGERDRYKFVRRALGTDVFADSVERAKKVHNKLKEKVGELERQLESHETEVSRLQSEIDAARDDAEDDIESVEKSVAFVKDRLAETGRLNADEEISTTELATRARKLVIHLREQANELSHALSDFNELRDRIERYEEGGDAAQRLEELSSEIEEIQDQIEQAEAQKEELEAALDDFKKQQPDSTNLAELHRIGEEIGLTEEGECPLCGESHTPNEFEARLRRLRSAVDEIVDQIDDLNDQIDEKTKQLNTLRGQKEDLENEREELQDERSSLISQLNSVHERVEDVLKAEGSVEELNEKPPTSSQDIQQEIPDLDSGKMEREINERRQLRTQLDEKVSDAEASLALEKIESLQSGLEEARQKREETKKELRHTRERAEQANKVRKRIESEEGQVHKDRIDKLAPLLTELYSRLRPHVDWKNLETKVRGNIQLYLRFDVDDKNPSLFFSSGQRRAVGLAFLLAVHLGCTWSRLNTLVLDDPVQHIDDFRALQLTEVLSAIRRSGRQMIVTVEDEALARLLRRRLRSSEAEEGQHVQMAYDSRSGARIDEQTVIRPMPKRVLAGVD